MFNKTGYPKFIEKDGVEYTEYELKYRERMMSQLFSKDEFIRDFSFEYPLVMHKTSSLEKQYKKFYKEKANPQKVMKSRQVFIQDNHEDLRESFWCDATNCDSCILRFQCFTSRSEVIVVTFPSDIINSKIEEFNAQKWRLRDGSSEYRASR